MADGLAGAQLLAGLLSLPKQIEYQRQNALDEDAVRKAFLAGETPQFTQAPPVGGTGAVGKVLSGMGTVGAALSTALGNPVKPPRMDLGAVSNIMNVKAQQDKTMAMQLGADALSRGDKKEAAKWFGRAGSMQGVLAASGVNRTPSSPLQLFVRQAEDEGLTGPAADARAAELYANHLQTRDSAAEARALKVARERDALRRAGIENDRAYSKLRTDELLGGGSPAAGPDGLRKIDRPEVQRWAPHVRRIAGVTGADPDLMLAQIAHESTGNPAAVSPKGAAGLMQVMPVEFAKLAPQIQAITGRPPDINNMEDNLIAGALHQKNDLAAASGDKPTALRIYNSGKPNGDSPETRDYVAKVMDDYQELQRRAQQPQASPQPGVQPPRMEVKGVTVSGKGETVRLGPPGVTDTAKLAAKRDQARVALATVNRLLGDPKALDLLVDNPKPPTGEFATDAWNAAKTWGLGQANRLRVLGLEQAGDPRVQKLRRVATIATPLVKLGGDVGAISEADKAPWDQFVKGIASGVVTEQAGWAKLIELKNAIETFANTGETVPVTPPDVLPERPAQGERKTITLPNGKVVYEE